MFSFSTRQVLRRSMALARAPVRSAVRSLYEHKNRCGFHSATPVFQKKILVSDPISPICIETFEAAGYEVDARESVPVPELLDIIGNYDGLIVRSGTQVTADVIEAGEKLRIIGRAGSGVDNIDLDAATKKGKIVMNTPGGNTTSAAELTLSLLMSLCRNIPNATTSLKSGKWERKNYMGTELSGKTIGVIGLGQIGRRVALSCQGLGMTTIGYDPLLSAELANADHISLMSVEEVLKKSDFITFHVPLTPETKNLINAESLKLCKDGVYIVNAARGGIIEEAALLDALNSGKVAGAAMDVYETEPPPKSIQPLLDHPNVVCTPHLGASTGEAQEKVAKDIANQMVDAFEGRKVSGVVNAKILSELHSHPELEVWVDLAERLGNLHAQLITGNLNQITLKTRGKALKHGSNLFVAAALKGMLSRMVVDNVNFVNAPGLAKDFGLNITQVHENLSSRYGNSLTITFHTDMDSTGRRDESGNIQRKFVGTVNNNSQRIVQINDYDMELVPEGNLLFFSNTDQPGMIAKISTILSKHRMNIASFVLGRTGPGGKALGAISVDAPVPDSVINEIRTSSEVTAVNTAFLEPSNVSAAHQMQGDFPATKPRNPNFSSGPCSKFPGYDVADLDTSSLGRSHRSALGKRVLQNVINSQKKILGIPDDYEVCIVAGSDTGAFELAMWSLLGSRPVDVVHFDSFGKGWKTDIVEQLKIDNVTEHAADFGQLPDLSQTNSDNDIVFTWNGTTSGVKVPNADWINADRTGLTLCDATSAVFAMDLPWDKLDVTTWSWQKALGGEAAHGMIALSPRAIERLELGEAPRGLPKIFRLTSGGKFNKAIAQGSVINTPSMLAVEDAYLALKWAESIGGLPAMMARSNANLAAIETFVEKNSWVHFLAEDREIRSNTSVCLTVDLPANKVKELTSLLADQGVAYDINSYKTAPAGIRIWCGATVEVEDVERLTTWLAWAYKKVC